MENKKNVSILLVGIGGYGRGYLNALCETANIERFGPFRIAGAVEIAPVARSDAKDRGIPLYDSVDDFYARSQADLAVISTPIHFHCEQIKTCLAHGSSVLCEKPLCATVEEVDEIKRAKEAAVIEYAKKAEVMERTKDAANRTKDAAMIDRSINAAAGPFVQVGYQLSFSQSVLALKNDILSGAYGKPVMLKTIVHYPRNESYYARNSWAGKKHSADGRMILDSPVHNAVSHHINNMLFLLGDAPDKAAAIKTVQAELYRGNPDVDNFDTAALRCVTDNGIEILFYTSHCINRVQSVGPINQYQFERAVVMHTDEREHETFYAAFVDGTTRIYEPSGIGQMKKLWDCVEAARGGPLPCSGVGAASAEVICVNGAHLSHPITTIPEIYVRRIGEPGKRYTDVCGLEKMLLTCFEKNILPSELADERTPWVTAGNIVKLDDIKNVAGRVK